MKRSTGMSLMRGSLLVALAVIVLACGRNETTASKSAAAYREAQAKGIPITGGHEHGGHDAEGADAATMTGMDHSTMTGMDHSTMAGMDHSKMTAADHSTMTGMDHSKMTAADHSTMAGMDHSKMTAADHSNMAGMDHSGAQAGSMAGMNHGAMPGMQHGGAAVPADVVIGVPRSNADMKRIEPGATLRPDDFDAPASTSVEEAQKASGGGGHEGHAPQADPHAGHVKKEK